MWCFDSLLKGRTPETHITPWVRLNRHMLVLGCRAWSRAGRMETVWLQTPASEHQMATREASHNEQRSCCCRTWWDTHTHTHMQWHTHTAVMMTWRWFNTALWPGGERPNRAGRCTAVITAHASQPILGLPPHARRTSLLPRSDLGSQGLLICVKRHFAFPSLNSFYFIRCSSKICSKVTS